MKYVKEPAWIGPVYVEVYYLYLFGANAVFSTWNKMTGS